MQSKQRLTHESFEIAARPAPRRGPARKKRLTLATLLRFAGIPLFLITWEAVAYAGVFNAGLFPPPTKVAQALWQVLVSGQLMMDTAASAQRMFIGYVSGAFVGMLVGTITGRFELGRNFLTPIIQMLRPIPPISFVPIAVLWFGLGEFAKDFLVFWGVFFVVWITTHLGLLSIDKIYINAARALGATERILLLEIAIPAAMPSILAGLRTAIPIAFYSLVAGEVAGATYGLAYMIEMAHTNFQVAKMFGGLAVLGLASAGADRLFVIVSSAMFPWAYPARS